MTFIVCTMTVLIMILYVDQLVTIINDLNLNLNLFTHSITNFCLTHFPKDVEILRFVFAEAVVSVYGS